MQTIATLVGYASGFALMRYHESPATMLMTSLAIDASLAPLTAVVAVRRGRSLVLWVLLGFAFGMWALAFALMVRKRPAPVGPSEFPTTSDAA